MTDAKQEWVRENELLAEIGRELYQRDTTVTVRFPRHLAEAAVDTWERDDDGDYQFEGEAMADRLIRFRSGSLALIGVAVKERGEWFEDEVQVQLDAWFVGHGLDCADDAGLLLGPRGAGDHVSTPESSD